MTDQITLTVERQPEGLSYRRKMVLASPSISGVLGWLIISLGIPLLAFFLVANHTEPLLIPDETLPEGLTPKAFQIQLERWSTA